MSPEVIRHFLHHVSPADSRAMNLRVLTDSPMSDGVFGLAVRDARTVTPDAAPGERVIMLNIDAISRYARQTDSDPTTLILATAVHEFGHSIVNGGAAYSDDDAELAACRRILSSFINDPDIHARKTRHRLPPFSGHEHPWLRASLHLAFRAASRTDFPLTPGDVIDAAVLGLSPAEQYSVSLGGEPERLSHLSISDILDTAAPAEFRELWTHDSSTWTSSQD